MKSPRMKATNETKPDLLVGAKAIAAHIFGTADARNVRRAYRLAERREIPAMKLGDLLCLRKSTWAHWVERQEAGFEAMPAE